MSPARHLTVIVMVLMAGLTVSFSSRSVRAETPEMGRLIVGGVFSGISTVALGINIITMSGTAAMIGEQTRNDGWAGSALVIGTANVVMGGLLVGYCHQDSLPLTVGISGLTMGVANVGVSLAYFAMRDRYKSKARVFPTTWADREGNVVPGVALQVVGW